MKLKVDPVTKLHLPERFIDEKISLKRSIDHMVSNAVHELSKETRDYCLVFHALFDKHDPTVFRVSTPIATFKLPPFTTNQMVFYVSNKREICELLWSVPPVRRGEKAKVEFNKEGVANLRKKGVMPSLKAV